jgi:hypothetical protein
VLDRRDLLGRDVLRLFDPSFAVYAYVPLFFVQDLPQLSLVELIESRTRVSSLVDCLGDRFLECQLGLLHCIDGLAVW